MLDITLIEGLCYLHPHKKEIVSSHPAMRGVWNISIRLLKQHKNSFLAPLLVDDIKREISFSDQSIIELIEENTGKSYVSLPWFGEQVMETHIEQQYGNLGCKLFDALYHFNIIVPLSLFGYNWKWIVVHPLIFQEQQSGMLFDLFKLIFKNVSLSLIAQNSHEKTEETREKIRNNFLNHFEHHWIDESGIIHSITHPKFQGGKIIHI